MLPVSDDISTKTGVAPLFNIALVVATKVSGVVITSSPDEISNASRHKFSADVPDATPMPYLLPQNAENSFRNH